MYNKENIIKNIKEEDKIIISKVLDKIDVAEKTNKIIYSDFYDMYQQKEIQKVLNIIKMEYNFSGGYKEAERKILILNSDKDIELPINAININFNKDFGQSISHRDVLGALIATGIKREKIGDIIINGTINQVIIHNDISDYICYNLEKIKNVKVKVSLININEVVKPQILFKEITASIPSLRLDCIVEEGFEIPRSKASQLVSSEKVFVNWEIVNKSSYIVKQDDVISVRQLGRIVFQDIIGKSKKGNNIVRINRLL